MSLDWIEVLLFTPLLGAVAAAISSKKHEKWIALFSSLLSGVIGIFCALYVIRHSNDMGWYEIHPWLPSYSIVFKLGLDGTNLAWVLLISFLSPFILVSEVIKKSSSNGALSLILLLQGFLIGSALSQDLFLLEFFWTAAILPVYFLLGLWGEKSRRESAVAFLVQSLLGNALLFFGFLLLYHVGEAKSFDLQELRAIKATTKIIRFLGHDLEVGPMSFALVSLGLILRMPLWPFRGWVRKAFQEGSVTVLGLLASCIFPSVLFLFERIQFNLFRSEIQEIRVSLLLYVGVNLFFAAGSLLFLSRARDLLDRAALVLFLIGLGGFLSFTENGFLGSQYGILTQGFSLAAFSLFVAQYEKIESGRKEGEGLYHASPSLGFAYLAVCILIVGLPGLGQFFSNGITLSGVMEYSAALAGMLLIGGLALFLRLLLFFSQKFLSDTNVSVGSGTGVDLSLNERALHFVLFVGSIVLGLLPSIYFEGLRTLVGWSK